MEFFDKLSKKASETYKGAAEKTGKIAREAKLKIKINENKYKINALYEEIGKKIYEKYAAGEETNINEELKEECEKIDELGAEIQNYHEEILSLSDMKICISCKEKIDKEFNFCPQCGTQQPEIVEEVQEPEVVEEEKPEEENTENENKSE